MTIVLPWPGESACAAPQKSAAASEARITSTLRCRASDQPREPRVGDAVGRLRAPGPRAASAARRASARGAPTRGHVERALQQALRIGAQLVASARGARRRRRSPSSRSGRRSSCRARRRRRPSTAGPRRITWSRIVCRPPAPRGNASACATGTARRAAVERRRAGRPRAGARRRRGRRPAGAPGRSGSPRGRGRSGRRAGARRPRRARSG